MSTKRTKKLSKRLKPSFKVLNLWFDLKSLFLICLSEANIDPLQRINLLKKYDARMMISAEGEKP